MTKFTRKKKYSGGEVDKDIGNIFKKANEEIDKKKYLNEERMCYINAPINYIMGKKSPISVKNRIGELPADKFNKPPPELEHDPKSAFVNRAENEASKESEHGGTYEPKHTKASKRQRDFWRKENERMSEEAKKNISKDFPKPFAKQDADHSEPMHR